MSTEDKREGTSVSPESTKSNDHRLAICADSMVMGNKRKAPIMATDNSKREILDTQTCRQTNDTLKALKEELRPVCKEIRQNEGEGFENALETAKKYYETKMRFKRTMKRVQPFFDDWLEEDVKVSPRTVRRHCKYYVSLCIERPEIRATVNSLYLKQIPPTVFQDFATLDNKLKRGKDAGCYQRYVLDCDGIFLIFAPGNARYDLAGLTSDDITSLAYPETAKARAATSSARNQKNDMAAADSAANLEAENRALRARCQELTLLLDEKEQALTTISAEQKAAQRKIAQLESWLMSSKDLITSLRPKSSDMPDVGKHVWEHPWEHSNSRAETHTTSQQGAEALNGIEGQTPPIQLHNVTFTDQGMAV